MNICKRNKFIENKEKTSAVDKCYFVKYVVAGSNPVTSAKKNKNGSVAQMAEPVMSFIAYCLVLKKHWCRRQELLRGNCITGSNPVQII